MKRDRCFLRTRRQQRRVEPGDAAEGGTATARVPASCSTWTARWWTRCRGTRARGRRLPARRGVPPPGPDFFHRTTGLTGVEVMRVCFGELPEAELRAFVAQKEAIYREMFAPRVPRGARFPRVRRRGPRGGRQGRLRDAGDADNIAFVLGHLDRHGFFDAVVGAHDVARGKPHPDLFLLAAQRHGRRPRRVPRVRGRAARDRGGAPRRHARRRDRDDAAGRRARRARPRDRAGDAISRRARSSARIRWRRWSCTLAMPEPGFPDGPAAHDRTRIHSPPQPCPARRPTRTRSSPSAGRSSPRCARAARRSRTTSAATRSPPTCTRRTARKDERGARAARRSRVAVAGRMMLKRVMGKACFATLQDMSGRIQLYVTLDARRRRGARRLQALGPGRHRRRDRARCSRPRPASCRSR